MNNMQRCAQQANMQSHIRAWAVTGHRDRLGEQSERGRTTNKWHTSQRSPKRHTQITHNTTSNDTRNPILTLRPRIQTRTHTTHAIPPIRTTPENTTCQKLRPRRHRITTLCPPARVRPHLLSFLPVISRSLTLACIGFITLMNGVLVRGARAEGAGKAFLIPYYKRGGQKLWRQAMATHSGQESLYIRSKRVRCGCK